MSSKLNEVRKKIDSLDNRIHDLLMERADLIIDVSKEKEKAKIPVVQPAREAVMIRRLLNRHRGPLPEAAIVGIWRELVGAVSLLQTGLSVAVTAREGENYCWDMSKNYFGSVLPMSRVSSPVAAISEVREGDSYFAVVPWPHDEEQSPWWPHLISQDKDRMRIVTALPYGCEEENISNLHGRALVIAKTNFLSSGQDRSFIALDIDQSVSRARIYETLDGLFLKPLSMFTLSGISHGGNSMHLIEVDAYVSDDDKKLSDLAKKFDDHNVIAISLGGYPVPPVFKEVANLMKAESGSSEKSKKTAAKAESL